MNEATAKVSVRTPAGSPRHGQGSTKVAGASSPFHFRPRRPAPMTLTRRAVELRHLGAPPLGSSVRQTMAEVGRKAVCDPGALLPGGFWEAVGVWLERPQVANKRLCGARLEARRSAVLPRAEAGGPRTSAGPQLGTAGRVPEESRGRRAAATAPLLAGAPGQPGKAGVEEGDVPASELDSLWSDFSRSLCGNREMLAFLAGSRAGSRPEAQHELDVVLRTVILKSSPHRPLLAPTREMVVQGMSISLSRGVRGKQSRTPVKAARVGFN